MLSSPTPIKFCTSFNVRSLISRLTESRVIEISKWIRSLCVLLLPLLHPPLLQGPLLVLAQQGLRWLPAPPRQQVLCSFPSETGQEAGPQSSTTMSDALAVTYISQCTKNTPAQMMPSFDHFKVSPSQTQEPKAKFVSPIFPNTSLFQLLSNLLEKESTAFWIKEA